MSLGGEELEKVAIIECGDYSHQLVTVYRFQAKTAANLTTHSPNTISPHTQPSYRGKRIPKANAPPAISNSRSMFYRRHACSVQPHDGQRGTRTECQPDHCAAPWRPSREMSSVVFSRTMWYHARSKATVRHGRREYLPNPMASSSRRIWASAPFLMVVGTINTPSSYATSIGRTNNRLVSGRPVVHEVTASAVSYASLLRRCHGVKQLHCHKLGFRGDGFKFTAKVVGFVNALTGRFGDVGGRAGRRSFPDHIPRYEVEAEVPDELKNCPEHGQRKLIGYDRAEKLELEPPKLKVRVTLYPKYACAGSPDCGVASPERPTGLVEGDKYDTSVAA